MALPLSVLFIYAVYRVGLRLMASFSQPVPEPPPPGELRKVRLDYRCSLCGTEVRMTRAPSEMPEPPRCCMDEMDLVRTEE